MVDRIVTIETSLARRSTTVKKPTSIAGASIPALVAATEVSSLSASAQHDDADTPGVPCRTVAAVVFESCITE